LWANLEIGKACGRAGEFFSPCSLGSKAKGLFSVLTLNTIFSRPFRPQDLPIVVTLGASLSRSQSIDLWVIAPIAEYG